MLDAGGTADSLRYLWLASGSTGKTEMVYDTVKYYVQISNLRGCATVDSIEVTPACVPRIYIPEGIVPGSSNPKDHYFSIYGKYFDNIELSIYNRWGQVVFFTTDKEKISEDKGWDGNLDSSPLPMGVYPYVFKYEGIKGQKGQKYIKKGAVTIVR